MATRRPLVVIGGVLQELPLGDSLPGGGGGAFPVEVELDFGLLPLKRKTFNVADAAVTTLTPVVITQSGNAATGRAADENEWTVLVARAVSKAGSFDVFVDCVNGHARGKFKFNYMVGA